ncbi:hypothetical protein L2750_05180 [Shewanella submarina]|uniref:Oligosaccharide repeat unit polymerase n=1 Tax=Shewanella submarina TaxID=2016376 RepID=A0ABV7GM95_9GAMM|nr:hypothetical protein [Shewanella submarina]MCL1036545.1 hypothetical protein [Shewanella submarina]
MWISLLALTICLLALCLDYVKSGYLIVLNPFSWVVLLILFYFAIPSLFSEQISNYYNWGLFSADILYSRLLTLLVTVYFSFLLCLFSSKHIGAIILEKDSHSPVLIWGVWLVIVSYIFWLFKLKLSEGVFSNAFLYDADAAKDPYKLKNIAYLLIPVSIYLYFDKYRFWVFIPNILIVLLDILHGSRTTAFICLVPILICFIIRHKKLYLTQLLALFMIMLAIGVVRSDNVVQNVPWYISAIGEFRETYITLPLYITDVDYVGNGSFLTYIGSLLFGIVQPLRESISNTYILPGTFIARDVARGYGLGSNFLIESLYFGFYGLIASITLLTSFMFILYRQVYKVKNIDAVLLITLFIVFSRLIVREGIPVNIGLYCFILIFYISPIFLMRKVKL